jgi:hypothetical protein
VIARSPLHRIVNALMVTILVGFFVVRYAVRRYAHKELVDLPDRKSDVTLGGHW